MAEINCFQPASFLWSGFFYPSERIREEISKLFKIVMLSSLFLVKIKNMIQIEELKHLGEKPVEPNQDKNMIDLVV